MEYKNGDRHPTKNRIFWSYSCKDRTKARELWMSPEAFQRKVDKLKESKRTGAYKERSRKYYQLKKEYIYQRDKERKIHYRKSNPFALMISSLKLSAKKRKLEFSLTLDELKNLWDKQKGKCYYTGIEMHYTYNNSSPKQMSLDRINSGIGYIIDNVVLCCQSINYAKHDYPLEEFKSFLNELYTLQNLIK